MTSGNGRGLSRAGFPERSREQYIRRVSNMGDPFGQKVTLRDIAEGTGTSISTVSRVLNGSRDVSSRTRTAVLEYVQAHPWASSRTGSQVPTGRATISGVIAVILPDISLGYSGAIVDGISETLLVQERRMALITTGRHPEREERALQSLIDDDAAGTILIHPSASNARLVSLQLEGLPLVVVDPRHVLRPGIPSVGATNVGGASDATRHLIDLGHHRIALIGGPPDWLASSARLSGFRAAMGTAGIEIDESLVLECDSYVDSGRVAADLVLQRTDRPTAIVAFNDRVAAGALQAAYHLGLSVPGDLSVVGFDDSELARVTTPSLTTVRQPLAEFGRLAAVFLSRLIDAHNHETLRVELETQLVVRESTGAPLTP